MSVCPGERLSSSATAVPIAAGCSAFRFTSNHSRGAVTFVLWDDTKIDPGDRWRSAIRDAIERAAASVLLISASILVKSSLRTDVETAVHTPGRASTVTYNGARCDMTLNYKDRIQRDPRIAGGQAVIKGTRVTLSTVLASLAEGATLDEILKDFPTLTEEDVRAAIAFAAASAQEDLPVVEAPRAQRP